MTAREEVERLLAEHQWHHTRETHCACGFRTPMVQLAVEGYLAHVAQVLDEAGLLAEPQCCCECSPPEFGGSLPDRECPLHAQPAAAPSEDVRDAVWSAVETIKQTGGAVEIHGVRIEPCDEYGQTAHDALVRADERRRVLAEVDKHLMLVAEGKYDFADFVDEIADLVSRG